MDGQGVHFLSPGMNFEILKNISAEYTNATRVALRLGLILQGMLHW
jgi:hypothetical protein